MIKKDPGLSVVYTVARSKQLEGTPADDHTTGVWPISDYRVWHGWGTPPKHAWPDFSTPEPPGIDQTAKSYRIHRYQRVPSADYCRYAISTGRFVDAAIWITEQWREPPGGVIELPVPGAAYRGVHSVSLMDFDENRHVFPFPNTWGRNWGDNGWGYLPERYLDAHLIEAWMQCGQFASPKDRTGIVELSWQQPESLGGIPHGREIYDAANDELLGWTFATERGNVLEVEELFVRPAYRRLGFGTKLANMLMDLSREKGMPLRLWVPFADAEPANRVPLYRIVCRLGSTLEVSGVSWAAFKTVPGHARLEEIPEPAHVPPRPTFTFNARTAPLAALHGGAGAPFGDATKILAEIVAENPGPLKMDRDGAVRVGGTRVPLDTVVTAFQQGYSAEEIAEQYPTVSLSDVQAAIGFYLRWRSEVEAYIEQGRQEAEALRREIESKYPTAGIRERLLAQRAARN